MNIKDSIHKILYNSRINSSLMFEVKDARGTKQFVPIEGITSCIMNLSESNQERLLNRCQKLQGKPDELMLFLEKLARSVVSRKL